MQGQSTSTVQFVVEVKYRYENIWFKSMIYNHHSDYDEIKSVNEGIRLPRSILLLLHLAIQGSRLMFNFMF